MKNVNEVQPRQCAGFAGSLRLSRDASRDLWAALMFLIADMFALFFKTKNFYWHISGQGFRDYRLLFDEQSTQILATTDAIADHTRRIGGTTLRSVGHISRLQRIVDNDSRYMAPPDMLAELHDDNRELTNHLRRLDVLCSDHGDVATANLLKSWIGEAESRTWQLFEAMRTDNYG